MIFLKSTGRHGAFCRTIARRHGSFKFNVAHALMSSKIEEEKKRCVRNNRATWIASSECFFFLFFSVTASFYSTDLKFFVVVVGLSTFSFEWIVNRPISLWCRSEMDSIGVTECKDGVHSRPGSRMTNYLTARQSAKPGFYDRYLESR